MMEDHMLRALYAGLMGSTMLFASGALAQQQPGGGAGGPGGGPPDFAQMRQQMTDRLRDQMEASDDEWKVIQPLLDKVQQLQRQSGGRGGPGMFGPGGPGGPPPGGPNADPAAQRGSPQGGQGTGGPGGGPNFGPGGGPNFGPGGPRSEVQAKQADLRETLQSQDAPADDVKARLAALREARAKAKADLAKAQDELRQVLSVRQEAVLVVFGMLE
jgi:hypothetical protein